MGSGGPEIGSRISLISKSGIRYEGSLYAVDPDDCTIALASVRSFGTENRNVEDKIPGTNHIYEYILFRGSDIKDIQMIETRNLPNDPAIVQMAMMPHVQQQQQQQQQPQQQPRPVMAPTVPFVRPIVYQQQQQQQQPQQFSPLSSSMPRMQSHPNQLVFNRSDLNLPGATTNSLAVSVSPATRTSSIHPQSNVVAAQIKSEHEPESLAKQAPKSAMKKQRKPAMAAAAVATAAVAPDSDDENEQPQKDVQQQQQQQQKRPTRQAKVPKQYSQGSTSAGNQVALEPNAEPAYQQPQPRQFRREYGTGPVLDTASISSGFGPRQQYQQQYRQGWRTANNSNRHGNDNATGFAGISGNMGGYRQYQRGGNYRYQNGDQRRGVGANGSRHQQHQMPSDDGVMPNENQRSTSSQLNRTIIDNGKSNRNQNRTPRIQFKEDYDFEQANIEFEELRQKLDNVTLKSSTTTTNEDSDPVKKDIETKATDAAENATENESGTVTTNGAKETDAANDSNAIYYDKCKSFFDNISCGESESNQKPDWNKERKLNTETFGLSSANNTNNNRRRPMRDNNNRNRVYTSVYNRSGGGTGGNTGFAGNDRRNYHGNRHGYHYNNGQQPRQRNNSNNQQSQPQGTVVAAAAN